MPAPVSFKEDGEYWKSVVYLSAQLAAYKIN